MLIDTSAGFAEPKSVASPLLASEGDIGVTRRGVPQSQRGMRLIVWIIGGLFGLTLAYYVTASFSQKLWLDDLYTLNLLVAPDLPKLWRAIGLGMDGNPPGYLTLAWLVTRLFPAEATEIVLRLLSTCLVGLGMFALYRATLRFTSATTALLAMMVFLTISTGVRVCALEMRAYSLYFCLDAVSLLFLLRWLETGSRHRWLFLAVPLTALSLTHTFGIAYVLCIAVGAAFVALANGEKKFAGTTFATAIPAILVFAAWVPVLVAQSEVGRPYGWIAPPDVMSLVVATVPQTVSILLLMAGAYVRFSAAMPLRTWFYRIDPRLKTLIAIATLELGFAGFVWAISKTLYPVFIPRYMTPGLIIDYAIGAGVLHLIALALPSDIARTRAAFLLAILCLLGSAVQDPRAEPIWVGRIPCVEGADEHFIENGVDSGGLPIVVESPHSWFPRRRYAQANYLFPLDWDVVERFPWKARNNATDFHIMNRFKEWAVADGILSTADLLARYPEFLVLQESGRAWLENLTLTTSLQKQEIKQGAGCTLWRVKVKTPA